MNDAKQKIVEKIKDSSNILVTVSTDPSVDELSAALGMTLLLNKMKKHATAVFSGAIPPAISFLDPEKTFEGTVDSLRDFIIALNKEKADHLRYKVDGDVVKIFITPYRTTITSDDLEFSQGDYNVELVLALGVKNSEHLDAALEAHGRILHDATVATVGVGEDKSELGSIDWSEQNASSLSEMLVGLADALKSDRKLLDEQIATAFLTGIVAATDRFSNNRTSSRVMTIAADLMAAGANQQLIASKLEEAHEIGDDKNTSSSSENSDGTTNLSEGESTKLNKKSGKDSKPKADAEAKDDGSLTISHEKQGDLDEVARATEEENQQAAAEKAKSELEKRGEEAIAAKQKDAARAAEEKLAEELAGAMPAVGASPSVADLQKDLAAASAEVNEAATQAPAEATTPLAGAVTADQWQGGEAPTMGGTLNATTEQAAEDNRRAIEQDRNRKILTHDGNHYVGDAVPDFQSPLNAVMQPKEEQPIINPLDASASPTDTQPTAPARAIEPPAQAASPEPTFSGPTLADIDRENRGTDHEEARAAVDAAFGAVPLNPASSPQENAGVQPLGEVPYEEPTPTPQSAPPTLPPMPDFSTLPPLPQAPELVPPAGALPPEKLEDVLTPAPSIPAPQPNDPGQFKIPGQS